MRVVQIAIALAAILSLSLYAFTGMTLWAPLSSGDDGRALLLIVLHMGAIFQPVIRMEKS